MGEDSEAVKAAQAQLRKEIDRLTSGGGLRLVTVCGECGSRREDQPDFRALLARLIQVSPGGLTASEIARALS